MRNATPIKTGLSFEDYLNFEKASSVRHKENVLKLPWVNLELSVQGLYTNL